MTDEDKANIRAACSILRAKGVLNVHMGDVVTFDRENVHRFSVVGFAPGHRPILQYFRGTSAEILAEVRSKWCD
jgi:hypothetical protein